MAEINMANLKGLEMLGHTRQMNPGLLSDGESSALYINRSRALQVNTREGLVDLWTRSGRVFIVSNPVIGQPETMSANGTAITLTAPSIRYTVPAGGVVVPIHVQVSNLRVITKDDLFAVIATASDSFTSGGDAVPMVPYNALVTGTGGSGNPGVTNLHYSDTAIVEAALVGPRLLMRVKHEGVTGEVDAPWEPSYNILAGDPMVYLVGPASFLVFAIQETTAAEAEWSMSWAVLDYGIV